MAKKINPLFYAFLVPLVGGMALVAFALVRNASMADLNTFSLSAYQSDWKALAANTYLLRCQIENQLGQRENTGRVLVVKLLDNTGRVPIFVPIAIKQNFETGQRFKMRIRVRENGALLVEEAEKF
ncbi:MAG: hypothetical protein LBD01_01165 [Puniceicoccales bacterium]|nr:hypothetical protein [Puniceicoccales bacterium]